MTNILVFTKSNRFIQYLLIVIIFGTLQNVFNPVYGQWQKHTVDPDRTDPTVLYVADIDGDNDLDVVSASAQMNDVVWYENGGDNLTWTKLSNNIYFLEITFQDENTGELRIKRLQQSEISIKNRGLYINRFEKNQTIKKEIKQKQEVEKYVYSNPGTSIYFELAGKGLFAINVDYRINKFNALSVGISPAEGGVLPSIMYYKFSGMKHRFETGIGITGILGQPEGLIGIFVNGAIGYRYQKKNGLIFRIGYTPLIGISGSRVAFIPLFFGVSLGYSF